MNTPRLGWLARHGAILFVIMLVGFTVAAFLGTVFGGGWPALMRATISSAAQATALLVGVLYVIRVGMIRVGTE